MTKKIVNKTYWHKLFTIHQVFLTKTLKHLCKKFT
nr:MAG TPA: hypothetical protein [Caudoviricetes sp.]